MENIYTSIHLEHLKAVKHEHRWQCGYCIIAQGIKLLIHVFTDHDEDLLGSLNFMPFFSKGSSGGDSL